MSAAVLLAELEAAGVRLSRDGGNLRFQTRPGVSIAPYRECILAYKPELLAELAPHTMAASGLEWRHVYQGPVEPTVPPPGWDGTVCANCSWPDFCRVLGPRNATLPGGPCPAFPGGAAVAHDAN